MQNEMAVDGAGGRTVVGRWSVICESLQGEFVDASDVEVCGYMVAPLGEKSDCRYVRFRGMGLYGGTAASGLKPMRTSMPHAPQRRDIMIGCQATAWSCPRIVVSGVRCQLIWRVSFGGPHYRIWIAPAPL
jgi:hypothetical protein